jgi:PEGA domain-containing protein/tetratricopeptide repeat protein
MRRLSVFLVVLWCRQAGADPMTDVRARFDHGQELFQRGDYAAAAAEFHAAFAIKPLAALLYDEAVCYEHLGDFATAVKLYTRYLDDYPDARDARAVKARKDSLKERGKPNPPPPLKPVFVIESDPPGATVYLDDQKSPPLGVTPWNGTIEGAHQLIVVAEGYKSIKKDILGKPDVVTTIVMSLQADKSNGFVDVRANIAGADVFIGEREGGAVGRTPYLHELPPGKYAITITHEGYDEDTREITLKAGESLKLRAELRKLPVGFVRVEGATVEGAAVKLDGQTVCNAPCRFRSPSGAHTVIVEKSGAKPFRRQLAVADATETTLAVRLAPRPARTDLIWKFGAAAVLLGGGVGLAIKAQSIRHDLESDMGPLLPPSDPRFSAGKTYTWAADGLLVAGGLLTAYAVWSVFTDPGPASTGIGESRSLAGGGGFDPPRAMIAPTAGRGYAGLAAELRF